MQHTNPVAFSELVPPPKRRTPPSEQTDEAPGLLESEHVDVEREAPLGENESIERNPRDRRDPEPPAFEE
jgi:hypothetical protein